MNASDDLYLGLSALLDGELERDERIHVLDRLATDPGVREAYLDMRRLEEVVNAAELPGTLPVRLWRAVLRKVGAVPHRGPSSLGRWLRPVPIPAWALGVATVLVLTLVVWGNVAGPVRSPEARLQPGVTIEVGLGSARDGMDDTRFVELTTELLRADRRYHRKMLEVMQEVEGSAFIAEGADDRGAGDEARSTDRPDLPADPRVRS